MVPAARDNHRIRVQSASYQLLTCGLAVLMMAAVLGSLTTFWHIPMSSGEVLVISAAGAAVGWLLWRAWLWALGAALAGMAAAVFLMDRNEQLHSFLTLLYTQWLEFWDALSQYQWDVTFGHQLGQVFVWASAVGLGILIVREALVRGSLFWSLVTGVIIFGIQWAWYFDPAASYFAWYCVIAFFLWACAASARRDALWEAAGRKIGYGAHFTSALAWVLAASLMAAILPTDWAPIDLGRFTAQVQEAFPSLKYMRGGANMGTGGRFSLKSTGFSSNLLELGGKISLDQTVAFDLILDAGLPDTAYLRGSTAAVYTGRGWNTHFLEETAIDPEMGLPASYGFEVPRHYFTYRIEPQVPLGLSVFNILEAARIEGLTGLTADADGNIAADRVVSKYTPYTVSSRWVLYNADQIREAAAQYGGSPLSERFDPYLRVSGSVPDRVKALTEQVTAGEVNPFDKALAIERYLMGFSYTLDVPATPQRRDFVDFFLFDLKQGYCVYYASAMTVMLRQAGIPARWVQGFAVPPSSENLVRDGKTVYPVRNSLAHAWVEAYFPGYGWVTFDPTPRGDLPGIPRDAALPDDASSAIFSDPSSNDPVPDSNSDEFFRDVPEDTIGTLGPVPDLKRQLPRWALWALAGLTAAAGIWLLLQHRLRRQDEFSASEPKTIIQEAWEKSAWLLGRFGISRKRHQTAYEYADDVGGTFPSLRAPARDVAHDYTAARYGPPEIEAKPELAERARQFWTLADELVLARFGWLRYLLLRLTARKRS